MRFDSQGIKIFITSTHGPEMSTPIAKVLLFVARQARRYQIPPGMEAQRMLVQRNHMVFAHRRQRQLRTAVTTASIEMRQNFLLLRFGRPVLVKTTCLIIGPTHLVQEDAYCCVGNLRSARLCHTAGLSHPQYDIDIGRERGGRWKRAARETSGCRPNVPHAKLRGRGRAATRIAARWLLPCALASAQMQFAASVTPSELCSAQAARPPGRSRAVTASVWS